MHLKENRALPTSESVVSYWLNTCLGPVISPGFEESLSALCRVCRDVSDGTFDCVAGGPSVAVAVAAATAALVPDPGYFQHLPHQLLCPCSCLPVRIQDLRRGHLRYEPFSPSGRLWLTANSCQSVLFRSSLAGWLSPPGHTEENGLMLTE